jgi:phytol kinase
MLTALAAVFVVFLILVFAEYLSRYKGVHSELTRKLVHILVGIFVAFWPFFLSWRQIQLLSVMFVIVVALSIRLNIFRSIHAVSRNALGELLFGLIVGILALIVDSEWIFAAAMLHLSLADGLAAIVGLLYGEGNTYKVLGHTKSMAGSIAFFFTSVLIMIAYAIFSDASYGAMTLIGLPIMATIAENFSIKGTDNLVIPMMVALVLTSAI